MLRKKITKLFGLIFLLTLLCGCDDLQIIEDKDAKYKLVPHSKDELETDVYYVKEGTKFYEVHDCDANSKSLELDMAKTAWTIQDSAKIPSFYKGELLAYASSKADIRELKMERYEDSGYSIGVHGLVYEDGYLSFEHGNNAIVKTSAHKEFNNERSTNILIETINGVPVTKEMINDAGVIIGMEKDKAYEITFFAGTYYGTVNVIADTHYYRSFEAYTLNEVEMTKNGYIAVYLPEDLKSGYYRIEGEGFFKYYNYKKGEKEDAMTAMNEPYFLNEESQIMAYSQQFTFSFDNVTKNASVVATYKPESITNEKLTIKMMVTTPDGKQMIVKGDKKDGIIKCDMQTSSPGKWLVNITPQSLHILDVKIEENQNEAEATKEVFNIPLDSSYSGIIFRVEYEGEGTVTAQVVAPDNSSYDMGPSNDYSEKVLEYNFAYLPMGAYQVNVYHYPDTKIKSVDYYIDEEVKEIDIITVEE